MDSCATDITTNACVDVEKNNLKSSDIYVCTFVCTYLPLYLCMHLRMNVCMYLRMLYMYPCAYVPMYLCTYVLKYLRMNVCMYLCTCVCMYVMSTYVMSTYDVCKYTCALHLHTADFTHGVARRGVRLENARRDHLGHKILVRVAFYYYDDF